MEGTTWEHRTLDDEGFRACALAESTVIDGIPVTEDALAVNISVAPREDECDPMDSSFVTMTWVATDGGYGAWLMIGLSHPPDD